jgi:choline dehydrogenase
VAVHANFLSEPRDVTALLHAVQLCREIGNSPALRPFVHGANSCPDRLIGSAMERWLRAHPAPTFTKVAPPRWDAMRCRSWTAALRVYGVQGLRIADGSVMPAITTGNTMAPCVVIGERAADLVLREHVAPVSRNPA